MFLRTAFFLIPLLLFCRDVSAINDTTQEIQRVVREFVSNNELSYRYEMNAVFPHGQKDKLTAEVYINRDKGYLYNSNGAFTIIYSRYWFYKADHRKKTVMIVNLQKYNKSDLKRAIEKDIFDNGMVSNFIDSTLLKYAQVKSFVHVGSLLKADLNLASAVSTAREINFSYDLNKKLMRSYSMQMELSSGGSVNNLIKQHVTCTGFQKNVPKPKYRIDNFFTVNDGKLSLKKYNQYKLYSQL